MLHKQVNFLWHQYPQGVIIMAGQHSPVRFGFQRFQYAVVIGDMDLRLEERVVTIGEPPDGWTRWIGYGQIDEELKFGKVQGPAPFALPGAVTFEDAMGMALAAYNTVKKKVIQNAIRNEIERGGQQPLIVQPG